MAARTTSAREPVATLDTTERALCLLHAKRTRQQRKLMQQRRAPDDSRHPRQRTRIGSQPNDHFLDAARRVGGGTARQSRAQRYAMHGRYHPLGDARWRVDGVLEVGEMSARKERATTQGPRTEA
jgi:hypothetical protein